MPIFYYAFGILLWLIPYTLLAIGMWVWSKGKSKARLHKAAMIAPLILIVLMLIETTLISLPVGSIEDFAGTMLGQTLLSGGFSLVFGYLCVGIVMGIYKMLQTRGFIQEEASSLLPES